MTQRAISSDFTFPSLPATGGLALRADRAQYRGHAGTPQGTPEASEDGTSDRLCPGLLPRTSHQATWRRRGQKLRGRLVRTDEDHGSESVVLRIDPALQFKVS